MSGETPPNQNNGAHDVTQLPTSFQTKETQLIITGDITVDPSLTLPPTLPALSSLHLTNLRMPLTPPSRVMNIVNGELFEERIRY